jgi:hypothetical protein
VVLHHSHGVEENTVGMTIDAGNRREVVWRIHVYRQIVLRVRGSPVLLPLVQATARALQKMYRCPNVLLVGVGLCLTCPNTSSDSVYMI